MNIEQFEAEIAIDGKNLKELLKDNAIFASLSHTFSEYGIDIGDISVQLRCVKEDDSYNIKIEIEEVEEGV